MQGVKDVIWEQGLFNGTWITAYLYDLAEAEGLGDATPAAKEWVTARWLEIARSPYNNDSMRSFMFALLKAALTKTAAERTAGEKKLIKSFATYIQQHRTYLAEQALAMYDSWKAADDLYRAQTGQNQIAWRIVLLRDGSIRLSRNADRIDGIRRSGRRHDRRPRRGQQVRQRNRDEANRWEGGHQGSVQDWHDV